MKQLLIFAVIITFAGLAAGQVTTLKNDIPESQYVAADAKAKELLKTANYRSIWALEYFEDRSKPGRLSEKTLIEIIQPDRKRAVEEQFYDMPSREESIWVDKALYFKRNEEPWVKYSGGSGINQRTESGQVTNQYRFLPAVEFEGKKADFYEHISVRTANKFSQTDYVVVRYVRTTRTWYSLEGKLLKIIEDTTIEGKEALSRQTTTYEYDPKDLKIEAPIKEPNR